MIYLIIIITKLIKMQRSPCLFEAVKCRWFMQCLLTYPFQIPRSWTTGEEMSFVGIIVKFRVLRGWNGNWDLLIFGLGKWDLGQMEFRSNELGFVSLGLGIPKTKFGMETHLYNTHHM